ncbi:RWP-RK domain [Ostreococcus tauri]|uniref:RWP-RK domain n=1 Tax=Ostreococcus tauri TaxID=70448 RepID=A0A096PBT9_OSTTA|nr:RWP-RK domain [Ostreococcus tauri]CEG02098.1 RWP-RK domain [Ostreococcus tauri]|eukprot:XP_022841348.1 RWP-RK domain [Ostreococcus tauri]
MITIARDGENDATRDMGLDCVYAHALLSADDAAIELGFGTTTFKKRLRQLGVRRWPGRQFAGVLKCYEYIVTVLNSMFESFEHSVRGFDLSEGTDTLNFVDQGLRNTKIPLTELVSDLDWIESYAYDIEQKFLRTGVMVDSREYLKLQSKVYKHRAKIYTYARPLLDKQIALLRQE